LKVNAADMGDPTLPGSPINTIGNSFAGFSMGRRPMGANDAAVSGTFTTLVTASANTFGISVNDGPWIDVSLFPWNPPAATIAGAITFITGQINTALGTLTPSSSVTVTMPVTIGTDTALVITSSSGNNANVRVRRGATNDIAAALMLGVDQGGVEPTRWSNFRPAPTASLLPLGALATPGDLTTLDDFSVLLQSAITQITLDALPPLALNLVTSVPGDDWVTNAPGASAVTGNNDGVREKLRAIAGTINAVTTLPYRAEVWGYQLAIIAKGGTVNSQPTTIDTTVAPLNNAGFVKNVRQYTLGSSGTSAFSVLGIDGSDGTAPGSTDYIGNPLDQTGFYALDQVDLFNLMVIPGDAEVDETAVMALVWGPASAYCKSRRAFLLIDAPKLWTQSNGRPAVTNNTQLINNLRAGLTTDYSAVFYPRLTYANNGLIATIGASGAVAGLMARTDADRGVWKAPAGIEATISGVLGLDVKLTDMENGVLNKKGANCLRVFPSGIVNWGGRTLDGDDDFGSDWKYIPIRRLALMIEESLFRGTQWVVFEPNDEPLWAKIRLNVNAYMMSLFNQGAFQGTAPKDAFFVRCDSSTTTQNDRNLGIVNIQVGFAPLKPAEFVVITIQQIAGDL
jgi:hypothetical protein